MKNISFLLLLTFFACQPKKEKPEIDYVNIEIFGHPPSSLRIDLLNKTMTFSKVQYFGSYPEDCKILYEKVNFPLVFTHFELNDDETKQIRSVLNNTFFNEVKLANKKNKSNEYEHVIFDGISFELDIVKDGRAFSTEDFIILEDKLEIKIYEILKILYNHTENKTNKEYLERLFVYLKHDATEGYIHGLH